MAFKKNQSNIIKVLYIGFIKNNGKINLNKIHIYLNEKVLHNKTYDIKSEL